MMFRLFYGIIVGNTIKILRWDRVILMVVALGAFEAYAKKDSACVGTHVRRFSLVSPDGDRSVVVAAALRGEKLADEGVVRRVLTELSSDPAIDQVDGFDAHPLGVGAQEVHELGGPEVGPVGIFQKLVHKLRSLVGGIVGKKFSRLLHSRQRAECVQ